MRKVLAKTIYTLKTVKRCKEKLRKIEINEDICHLHDLKSSLWLWYQFSQINLWIKCNQNPSQALHKIWQFYNEFTWKCKWHRSGKKPWVKPSWRIRIIWIPVLQTYGNKTVEYWFWAAQTDQWNRTENPKLGPHMVGWFSTQLTMVLSNCWNSGIHM